MLGPAATSPAAASPQAAGAAAVRAAWVGRNVHGLIFAAVYAVTLFGLGAQEFVQDTWLTLSGGRDIAEHGLPWHERLTLLNHGHRWFDQQWLGKVVLFDIARVGGMRLLLVVHVAFVLGAVAVAMAVARRRGATDVAVFWIALATMTVAPWAWQMRVQSLAYVLFVGVLALLSTDRGRIGRRTFLVLPLLALWANVHGSATLGVVLALSAGSLRLRRQPVAGLLLMVGSAAALFASPYGVHLIDYYHTLLLNPTLTHYIDEWRPTSYPAALPFFALALATTWLVARNPRALCLFEKTALIITGLSAFMAIRGIVWFALAVVLLLPKVLDAERRPASPSVQRVLPPLAILCGAAAVFVATTSLVRLPDALARAYPAGAASVAARAAAADSRSPVFASERYANWLLWREPQLAGRLVYDVRFELFTAAQFQELALFHDRLGSDWAKITSGARVLVLDAVLDRRAIATFRANRRWHVIFRDAAVIALART